MSIYLHQVEIGVHVNENALIYPACNHKQSSIVGWTILWLGICVAGLFGNNGNGTDNGRECEKKKGWVARDARRRTPVRGINPAHSLPPFAHLMGKRLHRLSYRMINGQTHEEMRRDEHHESE